MPEKLLVICNAYPSDQALYRNGFIHRRVKAYVEAGLDVRVFYNHEPVSESYEYEFDGIRVRVGNEAALESYIGAQSFDGYLVHFAEPQRIRPLQRLKVEAPIIIWVHGFEAEAWYRRWFNFIRSPRDVREALKKREEYYSGQNSFFHDLMEEEELNISFVNVSEWFQKYIVEPDNHAEFRNSTVIPNLVDEVVFPYTEKTDDQRLKILSIRPYASLKYANDQTVGAILELSKRPYFDALSFTICGSGPMFDETVKPLRKFKNVRLENRFFSQEEIRQLHAEHGVFLSPTRFDSQGVSMCEASSSGLVTISSDIAAVPEFFEHRVTGLLAQPESVEQLADFIEELYFDPELFQRLSKQGAESMVQKCGRKATVGAEVAHIRTQLAGK